MKSGFYSMFQQLTGTIYMAIGTNALLIVATAPLVAVYLVGDLGGSWPLLVIFSPLLGPAVAAAFTVFQSYSEQGVVTVVRTFVRGWRASFRRAIIVGVATSGLLFILAVDVVAVRGSSVGAFAIPMFVMAAVLTIAVSLHILVGVAADPDVTLRTAWKACLFLAVRRWYITAVSLAVVGVLSTIIATAPALGLGLIAAPVLYLAWANSSYTLRPALAVPERELTPTW